MRAALACHWPEYLLEAGGLGLFMLSACLFTTLIEHPASPVQQAIADPTLRRLPLGLAMGLTAIALIYSPLGQRSGAHLNPVVTATFFRLGKVAPWDAACYAVAQVAGGIVGVQVAALLLGERLGHPAVGYVATVPGAGGAALAFAAEGMIAFGLMLVVLTVSNTPRLARYTGLCAGALVATYIVVEAPFSGMSMNPARTLASTVPAGTWAVLWLYVAAPLLGMLLAAETYLRFIRPAGAICAKLQHPHDAPCIFRCGYRAAAAPRGPTVTAAAGAETLPTVAVSPSLERKGSRA
ncbi:MAG TPA: aquaporin [Chloroflexota bacterium]|jgi:aquaporin Z